LDVDADRNFVIAVGLDRFLRVFDLKSREEAHQVYLKQRLTCVRVVPPATREETAEEFWQSIPSSGGEEEKDRPIKRRKRRGCLVVPPPEVLNF
jgi:hypothetical protein